MDSSSGPTRVMIVDDEPRLVAAWERLIGLEADLELAPSLDRADSLRAAIGRHHPAVVLMDMTMAGADPHAAVAEAAREFPATRIVIYSARNDPEAVRRSRRSGAAAHLDKCAPVEEVLDAIRRVARGETLFDESGGA